VHLLVKWQYYILWCLGWKKTSCVNLLQKWESTSWTLYKRLQLAPHAPYVDVKTSSVPWYLPLLLVSLIIAIFKSHTYQYVNTIKYLHMNTYIYYGYVACASSIEISCNIGNFNVSTHPHCHTNEFIMYMIQSWIICKSGSDPDDPTRFWCWHNNCVNLIIHLEHVHAQISICQ